MRWPLKHQILLRMLVLLVTTIAAVTVAQIQTILVSTEQREHQRLARIGELLTEARFPLSATVLENMKALSGAEFSLVDREGNVLAQTQAAPNPATSIDNRPGDHIWESGTDSFYYQRLPVPDNATGTTGIRQLHIFLPRQSDAALWWQASRSPLAIAAFALPIALLVSFALAAQVTRPLKRLQNQVSRISEGDLCQLTPSRRDDEIRDLHLAMNDMAVKLQEQNRQLREKERLKALVKFADGIAHHLRNSTTGCRMAIELLAGRHDTIKHSENFEVAIRQLEIMDNTIQKFLLFSKRGTMEPNDNESVNLGDVLQQVSFLLRPSAEHLQINLQIENPAGQRIVEMSRDDAEQLMVNLIGNAIDAAAEHSNPSATARVSVSLTQEPDQPICLIVRDSGAGPSAEVAAKMFDPFFTGKREGTGLGLALVQEIANRYGGTVTWKRVEDQTEFTFCWPHPQPAQPA